MFIAFASLIVIAIAVAVNMIVGVVPTEYTQYDITGLGLFDLTEETESIIKAVDEKVTLYLIARDGYEDTTLKEFLNRYSSLNSNIKVETVDPEITPSITTANGTAHTTSSLQENSVIVSGEKRDYEADYSTIYTTDYTDEEMMNYYYYGVEPTGTTTFNAEQAITGAIDNVTSEDLPKIYTLTGHSEYELGAGLSEYLKTDNYTTDTLSLMTGDGLVPEDADCIVINTPASDISADELETLKTYVDDGGKLILITNYNVEAVDFTNLYALGEHYGMSVIEGMLMEANTNNYYQNPYYIIPNLSATDDITSSLTGSYTLFPTAHGISISAELDENITVSKLATTSSDAYTVSIEGTQINAEDVLYSGEATVAAMATLTDTEGKFVWFTSYGIVDDNADSAVSGGNSKLFLSTLGNLCEKKDSVAIAGKVMSNEMLVTTISSLYVMAVIFVVILPVAFIVTGIVISVIRRRR